ncbi:MAG TPA: hypothetical protein VHO06_15795 [Polyangia bacterium]|nr:hypothetical protein [Polyangia bacterium]
MRTIHASLMCNGCGRFTPHTFDELKEPPKGPGPAPVGPVYLNLMYVCDVCETERVFGNEPAIAGGSASEREARQEHATEVHGMRTVECPKCHGEAFDCLLCGDSGEVIEWDDREPCGPNCPLERPEGT